MPRSAANMHAEVYFCNEPFHKVLSYNIYGKEQTCGQKNSFSFYI